MAAVARGFRGATRGRPARAAAVRRRPAVPRDRARAALVRLRAARAARSPRTRSAPGSSCAVRRARPATGSPSTASPTRTRKGILAEPYRWAELEQLVFSPSRWERRLVGSTIATMTVRGPPRAAAPEVAGHGLALLDELIGDAEPDVQKALSWASRSLTVVDSDAAVGCPARRDRARRGDRRRPPRLGHPRRARQARSGRSADGDPRPARRHPPAAGAPSTVAAPLDRRPLRRAARSAAHRRTAAHLTHPEGVADRDRRPGRHPGHPHRGRDAGELPRLRDERDRVAARCPTCATASSPSIAGSSTRWARWASRPPARTASARRSSAR